MNNTDKIVILKGSDIFYNYKDGFDKVAYVPVGTNVLLKSNSSVEMTIVDFVIDENENATHAVVVWFDNNRTLLEATLPFKALFVTSDIMIVDKT